MISSTIYSFLGYPYVTPIRITSNESFIKNESLNFKRKAVYKNAQRWEFSVTLKDAGNSALFSDLMAHWASKGLHRSFDFPVPQHLGTERNFKLEDIYGVHGAPTVTETTLAGTSSVNITHMLANKFPAGRFITFDNHSKVYILSEGFETTGGIGVSEMRIFPSLRVDVPPNTFVNFFNVNAKVFNEVDNSSHLYTDGTMQDATINTVEDV